MSKKTFILLAIVLLLIVTTTTYGYLKLTSPSKQSANQSDEPATTRKFPNELGGLPLISRIEGASAFDELAELHGRRVPLENAYILKYKSSDNYIKFWISVSLTSQEATSQALKMTNALPRSGMYTAPQTFTLQGKTIYQPIDQHHNTLNYYFASGPKVIWLETNLAQEKIQPLLPEIVRKY